MGFAYKLGLKFFGNMGLQRVWPLGQIRNWMNNRLRAHEWPESYVVDGFTFYVPKSLRMSFGLNFFGKREELEFRLFGREIPKGGTVVDVGAHMGYYALPFARAAGPGGRVFCFEPEPGNLELLRKNIKTNGYENTITVIPKAVGDKAGHVDLFISEFNTGGHQVWDMEGKIKSLPNASAEQKELIADEHSDAPRRKVRVEMVSLDEFLKDYGKPIDFIKIDVEGAEGAVLAGMMATLKRSPNLKLHFEFIPSVMRLFGTDPREFLRTLSGLGFKFYSLLSYKQGIDRLDPLTVDEILARCSGNKSDEIFAKRQ